MVHTGTLLSLEEPPEEQRWSRVLGTILWREQDQPAEGRQHLERALDLEPTDQEYLAVLGELLEEHGTQRALCADSSGTCSGSSEQGLSLWLDAAHQFMTLGSEGDDDVAECYRGALGCDPDCEEALNYLCSYSVQAGHQDDALEYMGRFESKVRGWDLDDFEIQIDACLFFCDYAGQLASAGQHETAREKLLSSLALNPNHIPSLKLLGEVELRCELYEEAFSRYRLLVQLLGGSNQEPRPGLPGTGLEAGQGGGEGQQMAATRPEILTRTLTPDRRPAFRCACPGKSLSSQIMATKALQTRRWRRAPTAED